jgi:hypothetical protein
MSLTSHLPIVFTKKISPSLPFAPFVFTLGFLDMFRVHVIHVFGHVMGASGYVTCYKPLWERLPGMLCAPWYL